MCESNLSRQVYASIDNVLPKRHVQNELQRRNLGIQKDDGDKGIPITRAVLGVVNDRRRRRKNKPVLGYT